jgi:hypothetical protein
MTCYPRLTSSKMARLSVPVLAMVFLAACGGGSGSGSAPPGPVEPVSFENAPRFASGPIGAACNIHRTRTTSSRKCGCIQAAANLTLTQEEQQRSVRFFAEPELLQRIKLSDTPANERFWYAWARFAETAEAMCDGL